MHKIISRRLIDNVIHPYNRSDGNGHLRLSYRFFQYLGLSEVDVSCAANKLEGFLLFLLFSFNIRLHLVECFIDCLDVVIYEICQVVVISLCV